MAIERSMKEAIYTYGMDVVMQFLDKNSIPHPLFFRYSETDKMPPIARRFLEKVKDGPLVGTHTGLYCSWQHEDPCVFVNVPVTALPVQNPGYRNWSYPCWKTDRTAIGVLAHECGHYVEDYLQHHRISLKRDVHGPVWLETIKGKKVTSYEPVPSEAWAETMRLFILNPDLLRLGIPKRYNFVLNVGIVPSETRPWQEVLYNHPAYVAAGERWINA